MIQFSKVMPTCLLILSCGLAVHTVQKGVLPAFKEIPSDFPNYYVSARIVRSGGDAARLYDDAWFQRQMYDNGISQRGKFSPFPPATALVLVPLAGLSPLTALRILPSLNLLLIAAAAAVLSRLSRCTFVEASVIVLLSGMGLVNCIRLGQLYIAVSFFVLLGFFFLGRNDEIKAGTCLALPVPIKYFPAVYLVHLAIAGRWRTVFVTAGAAAAIFGLGVAILGWPVHDEYFRSVLPGHIQSQLSQQDPFSVAFQSFDSLLRNLFVYDPDRNPNPLAKAPGFFPIFKTAVVLLLTAALALGLRWAARCDEESRQRLSIALLGIWGLLVAPATATYHFVLLWLPIGYLLAHLRDSGRVSLLVLGLAAYAGIGFVPYSAFRSPAGRGILVLAGYPRLWMMCLLFFVALTAAFRASRASFAPRISRNCG